MVCKRKGNHSAHGNKKDQWWDEASVVDARGQRAVIRLTHPPISLTQWVVVMEMSWADVFRCLAENSTVTRVWEDVICTITVLLLNFKPKLKELRLAGEKICLHLTLFPVSSSVNQSRPCPPSKHPYISMRSSSFPPAWLLHRSIPLSSIPTKSSNCISKLLHLNCSTLTAPPPVHSAHSQWKSQLYICLRSLY